MIDDRFPNFFIVGAPKAGTTSLYHHLRQHPDVYMSPLKETSYFADEFGVENLVPELRALGRKSAEGLRRYLDSPPLGDRFGGVVTDLQDYRSLFAQVDKETAIGEASPSYLWSPTAALKISMLVPHAKIIMILRNPADRAFSQYLQMSNTGLYPLNFDAHLAACLANRNTKEVGMVHPFLEYGLYSEQVQRYLDAFPASQVGIWLYEDTRDPNFVRSVYTFLGVRDDFFPDTSKRHLQQRVPRVPLVNRFLTMPAVAAALRHVPRVFRPSLRRVVYRKRDSIKMQADAKCILDDYYREDVMRLEQLLGRDLSGWLGRRQAQ